MNLSYELTNDLISFDLPFSALSFFPFSLWSHTKQLQSMTVSCLRMTLIWAPWIYDWKNWVRSAASNITQYVCVFFLLWFQRIAFKIYMPDKLSQCWPEISVGRSIKCMLVERRSLFFSPGNLWPEWKRATDLSYFSTESQTPSQCITHNKHSLNIDEWMGGWLDEWMNVRNSQILLGPARCTAFRALFLPRGLALILADSWSHDLYYCSNTGSVGRFGFLLVSRKNQKFFFSSSAFVLLLIKRFVKNFLTMKRKFTLHICKFQSGHQSFTHRSPPNCM